MFTDCYEIIFDIADTHILSPIILSHPNIAHNDKQYMRTAISLSAIITDYVRAFDGIPQSRISLEVLTDNFFLYGRVYRSSVCYDPLNV